MPKHKTFSPTLKPPEFKRDSMGRFDRPRKTLSNTAKKTGLSTKLKETKSRVNPNFVKGHPGMGGRPKGSQNKLSVALKDAILLAGERAGAHAFSARKFQRIFEFAL